MISIASSRAVVAVAPESGGRIAQITVDDRPLLVEGGPHDHPMMWGSFPMAPWAGRVRHGRFQWAGAVHQLPLDAPPHAIHGTVWHRPWDVDALDATTLALSTPLAWELGGSASQHLELDDRALTCDLTVHAGDEPMPAELGWHPWFRKPDRLEFSPEAMYRRDDEGIPDGVLMAPGPPPWDDCFVNTDPVRLVYAGLTVTVLSDCDHWVVYDEPVGATCVEPQSGPPDAFNLRLRVLQPGEQLTRRIRIAWDS